MNKTILKIYQDKRKDPRHPARALFALKTARALFLAERLESEGRVRFDVVPDDHYDREDWNLDPDNPETYGVGNPQRNLDFSVVFACSVRISIQTRATTLRKTREDHERRDRKELDDPQGDLLSCWQKLKKKIPNSLNFPLDSDDRLSRI